MEEVFFSLKANVRGIVESSKAADLVNRERFDGIFLDLEMPKMSGFDLARWIRNSAWNRSTPIVIITGRDDRQTMQQVFSSGATFFLQKPVDRAKLTKLYNTVRGSLLETRRRFVRVPLHTEVVCTADSRKLNGMTWNLSQGGIQVEVSGLRLGQSVHMSFCLPSSGARIEAIGSVAWIQESRQGIKFDHLSAENARAIRNCIAETESAE